MKSVFGLTDLLKLESAMLSLVFLASLFRVTDDNSLFESDLSDPLSCSLLLKMLI